MDNQKCEIIQKPFLPGSEWENKRVWELGVWAGHSSVRYIMEPPVRPERRRNWDSIQPHILALLPTQSWELTALFSNQCIQLFQKHLSSTYYVPGIGRYHSEHDKEVLVLREFPV